jgi:hypothetical protein
VTRLSVYTPNYEKTVIKPSSITEFLPSNPVLAPILELYTFTPFSCHTLQLSLVIDP